MNNQQLSQSQSQALLDLVNPPNLTIVQTWPPQNQPLYQLSPIDQMAHASNNDSQVMRAGYSPEELMTMTRIQLLRQQETMLQQQLMQSPRQSMQPSLQYSEGNTSLSMQSPSLMQSPTSMSSSQSLMVSPILASSHQMNQSPPFSSSNNHPQSHIQLPPRGSNFQWSSVSSTPAYPAASAASDTQTESQVITALLQLQQSLRDPTKIAEAVGVLVHHFSHHQWPEKIQGPIFDCLVLVWTKMPTELVKKVLQRFTSHRFHWSQTIWSNAIDGHYNKAKRALDNHATEASKRRQAAPSIPSLPVLAPASAFVSPTYAASLSSMPANSGQSLLMSAASSLQQAPQNPPSSAQQSTALTPLPLNVPRPFISIAPKKINYPRLPYPLSSIPRPMPPLYDALMFADPSLKTSASTDDTWLLRDRSPNTPIYSRLVSLPHPPFFLAKNRWLTQAAFNLPESWHRRLWKGPSPTRRGGNFNDPENYPPREAVDEELYLSLRIASFKKPAQINFTSVGRGAPEDRIEWSEKVAVEVNGTPIDPPKRRRIPGRQLQTVLYVGQHAPVDITPLLKSGTNTVSIAKSDWNDAHYGEFIFCVQAFVRESAAVILHRLSTRQATVSDTNLIIAQALGPLPTRAEHEDEVSVMQSTVKMSLICPLSRSRIRVPVRSKLCQHIGCFDLQSYLHMNKGMMSKWTCPICGIRATSDVLVICQLTSAILLRNENVAVMEFTKVGEYRPSEMIASNKEDSDDGSDGFESSRTARKTQNAGISREETSAPESHQSIMEVVDLTAEEESDAPS